MKTSSQTVSRPVRALSEYIATATGKALPRSVMEIKLKDGRVLKHQTMAAKGSFENPSTRAEEKEKALDLMLPILGRKRSTALPAALWDFEKLKDVRVLRKMHAV